jgi:hypothetical protein
MDINNPWYQRLGEAIVAVLSALFSYSLWMRKRRQTKHDMIVDELQKLKINQEILKVEQKAMKELFQEGLKNIKDNLVLIEDMFQKRPRRK